MARQLRPGQLRTGSLYDITASLAIRSLTGSAATASTDVSSFIAIGNVTASVTTGTASFLITRANQKLFEVTSAGIAIFATQSINPPTGSIAPNGGIYFTSSSFFVGLE